MQLMQLISSLILTASIILLIIFSNPQIVFTLLIIGFVIYYLFYKYSKNKLSQNDFLIKKSLSKRLMFLKESFSNIRQIILYSLQDNASKRIVEIDRRYRQAVFQIC